MVNGHKYYCMTEVGAEILMIITSLVILICALWRNFQALIGSIGDPYPSLLLSLAYELFLPLMSYTYSQAQQYKLEVRVVVILFWMVIIEIIRILGDSTWELRKSLEQLVRLSWVSYLICSYPHRQWIWVSLLIACICSAGYEIRKGISFNNANDSYLIGKNPKLIHNYVKRLMLQDDLKTTPIDSCNYIVMGETNHEITPCSYGYLLGEKKSNSEGLFTVGRAFQLNSFEQEAFTVPFPSWGNTCLSLALAKMLRRRFAKLPVDEAGCRKALDFVVEGLIDYIGSNKDIETDKNDGEKNGSKRVFSIIQEELQMVSDYLNFKVPVAYNRYEWYNVVDFIGILIIFGNWAYLTIFTESKMYSRIWSSAPRLKTYRYNNCSYYFHTIVGSTVLDLFFQLDGEITGLLFVAYMLLQIYPICTRLLSKRWRNLNFVMMHIKDPSTDWRFYSSLTNSKPVKLVYRLIVLLANKFRKKARNYSTVLDLKAKTLLCLPKCIRRNIPLPFRTLVHSTDAKEAILESLKKSVARLSIRETSLENFDEASLLTNGRTSLQNYNMESMNWACMPNGSTTEAILVWHIATTLFHHQESSPQQNIGPHQKPANHENNNSIKKKQEVALAFSNYCHYLVKSLPELLPDEVEWTQDMYESVTKEILGAGAKPWYCYKKSTKNCHVLLNTGWVESSVVGKGVKLANQLMNYDKEGEPVWAMLADFWAEMMLFIAPSDNVEGHEKILYRQELITQLWALLTHAGIVTRPKPTDHQIHDSESNAFTEDV